jgi:hypothetical protein
MVGSGLKIPRSQCLKPSAPDSQSAVSNITHHPPRHTPKTLTTHLTFSPRSTNHSHFLDSKERRQLQLLLKTYNHTSTSTPIDRSFRSNRGIHTHVILRYPPPSLAKKRSTQRGIIIGGGGRKRDNMGPQKVTAAIEKSCIWPSELVIT